MTAYELRIHLRRAHEINMIGADYGALVSIHSIEHRTPAEHEHDDPNPETWAAECLEFGCDEAGHSLPDALWVIVLFLAILVLLRMLRVI